MIAYVFWHWRKRGLPAGDYEKRQRHFHAALTAAPPSGFTGSFSVGIAGADWAAGGDEAYEDWYLVKDFGALGALNEGAVSGTRSGPHDAAAAVAEGGTASIYLLRRGDVMIDPGYAHWFDKPSGMTYAELAALLDPVVDREEAALWMRQLALGPARELCLHARKKVSLPSPFEAIVLPLRLIWPVGR